MYGTCTCTWCEWMHTYTVHVQCSYWYAHVQYTGAEPSSSSLRQGCLSHFATSQLSYSAEKEQYIYTVYTHGHACQCVRLVCSQEWVEWNTRPVVGTGREGRQWREEWYGCTCWFLNCSDSFSWTCFLRDRVVSLALSCSKNSTLTSTHLRAHTQYMYTCTGTCTCTYVYAHIYIHTNNHRIRHII